MTPDAKPPLAEYLGHPVVVDVRSHTLTYLGILKEVTPFSLILADVDVHDTHESKTSREVYVMESRKYGIKANRREVAIVLAEVVSVSRLGDIIVY